MEGSCAAKDTNWNVEIVTNGKRKLGRSFLNEDFCIQSCLHYPGLVAYGCEYKIPTKECWIHSQKVQYGRGEGGPNGTKCIIFTPELEGLEFKPGKNC